MYICIYTCMYIYLYEYIYIHIHIYTYVYIEREREREREREPTLRGRRPVHSSLTPTFLERVSSLLTSYCPESTTSSRCLS